MSAYPLNQFAPAYKQGVAMPQEIVGPKPYDYVYNPPGNQLTGSDVLNDSKSIETDADFWLAGWYLSLTTGAFQIRLTDSDGYQLSDGFVNSAAISISGSDPTVFSPAHPFPAGGRIQIAIQNLSGADNPTQITFKGWKDYRMTRSQAI